MSLGNVRLGLHVRQGLAGVEVGGPEGVGVGDDAVGGIAHHDVGLPVVLVPLGKLAALGVSR